MSRQYQVAPVHVERKSVSTNIDRFLALDALDMTVVRRQSQPNLLPRLVLENTDRL